MVKYPILLIVFLDPIFVPIQKVPHINIG